MGNPSGAIQLTPRQIVLGKEGGVHTVYLDTPGPIHDELIIYSPDCILTYLAQVAAALGLSLDEVRTDLQNGATLEVPLTH